MNTLQDFRFQSYKLLMNNLQNINSQKNKNKKYYDFKIQMLLINYTRHAVGSEVG